MSDEKDRLGEQLHGKEKADEDRYFAELSKKQLEKLRERHAESTTQSLGQCPRCGAAYEVTTQRGVGVDTCPDCCGYEQIASREGTSWLSRLLAGFRR